MSGSGGSTGGSLGGGLGALGGASKLGGSGTVGKSCGHRTATGVTDYRDRDHHHRSSSSGHRRGGGGGLDQRSNSELLASPQGRHSLQHSSHSSISRLDSHKFCRLGQHQSSGGVGITMPSSGSIRGSQRYPASYQHGHLNASQQHHQRFHHHHHPESSLKSSDGSLSGSYRRLHGGVAGSVPDAGSSSLRYGSGSSGYATNGHSSGGGSGTGSRKHNPDSSSGYRMLQESSSSHNIPHSVVVPSPSASTAAVSSSEKLALGSLHHSSALPPPHQMLSYSISNSSDLAAGSLSSPSHSLSTPQFKKKFMHDGGVGGSSSKSSSKDGNLVGAGMVSKHESFDYGGNLVVFYRPRELLVASVALLVLPSLRDRMGHLEAEEVIILLVVLTERVALMGTVEVAALAAALVVVPEVEELREVVEEEEEEEAMIRCMKNILNRWKTHRSREGVTPRPLNRHCSNK
uniref:Uncharacterized protein n=1 Tax=Anopheles maculatus TaxID=74869 RepID=A0A182SHF1_9DIPT